MITVYGKSGCDQCLATTNLLDRNFTGYDYVDVSEDVLIQDALKLEGFRSLPVVEFLGRSEEENISFQGFRLDALNEVMKAEEELENSFEAFEEEFDIDEFEEWD